MIWLITKDGNVASAIQLKWYAKSSKRALDADAILINEQPKATQSLLQCPEKVIVTNHIKLVNADIHITGVCSEQLMASLY